MPGRHSFIAISGSARIRVILLPDVKWCHPGTNAQLGSKLIVDTIRPCPAAGQGVIDIIKVRPEDLDMFRHAELSYAILIRGKELTAFASFNAGIRAWKRKDHLSARRQKADEFVKVIAKMSGKMLKHMVVNDAVEIAVWKNTKVFRKP